MSSRNSPSVNGRRRVMSPRWPGRWFLRKCYFDLINRCTVARLHKTVSRFSIFILLRDCSRRKWSSWLADLRGVLPFHVVGVPTITTSSWRQVLYQELASYEAYLEAIGKPLKFEWNIWEFFLLSRPSDLKQCSRSWWFYHAYLFLIKFYDLVSIISLLFWGGGRIRTCSLQDGHEPAESTNSSTPLLPAKSLTAFFRLAFHSYGLELQVLSI